MENEQEQIERASRGDEAAFAALVTAHRNRVFRVCLAALGDRQEADEAAQDVFVRLFETIARFRGDSRLATWLYRVALNICADRRRSAWWRRWLRIDPADLRLDSPDRPDRRLEEDEKTRELLAALHKLPPPFRDALILRELEERDYADIAEILGVAIGTVESRLFRARAKLKALLLGDALKDGE